MEFPGASDNFLSMSADGHHFLNSSETFHTPSLGDEEFEIPPISLESDSALGVPGVPGVVTGFSDLGGGGSSGVPGNVVVGGIDPSFASTFVNGPSLSLMTPAGGGPMLGSALGMDLNQPISSQFSGSSPMAIDINHGLLGHNQLTTIDQSELSTQLGLSLEGGAILPCSPESPLSVADSPSDSLHDDDMEDFRRSVLGDSPVSLSGVLSLSPCVVDQSLAPCSSSGGEVLVRKKRDPQEPQKPVSAYAMFFRDTQAAIKGQNPSAAFREVSKIVASMWDSLGEQQKQVYKRKSEEAKREYLKAMAVYKTSQLETIEVMDTPPSPPAPPSRSSRIPQHAPDNNTITNICMSNIILDLPQVSTRSRTGAHKPAPPTNPRHPPPLQQMHHTPPRLQQMVHSPAPPPLQAKPKGGAPVVSSAPPPLQIKIVTPPLTVTTQLSAAESSPPPADEMEVELTVSPAVGATPIVCVRAGCTNPPVENRDWDREYCSSECVATHCRDVFTAWCEIRRQNAAAVS